MVSYMSHNVTFIDVTGTLYHADLNKNRNVVFIWSVDMCFIFIKQINVVFMLSIYKAILLYHYIINTPEWTNAIT